MKRKKYSIKNKNAWSPTIGEKCYYNDGQIGKVLVKIVRITPPSKQEPWVFYSWVSTRPGSLIAGGCSIQQLIPNIKKKTRQKQQND